MVPETVLGPSLDFCGQPACWINCIASCRVIVCSYCLVGLSFLEFPSHSCTMSVTLSMENGGFVLNSVPTAPESSRSRNGCFAVWSSDSQEPSV